MNFSVHLSFHYPYNREAIVCRLEITFILAFEGYWKGVQDSCVGRGTKELKKKSKYGAWTQLGEKAWILLFVGMKPSACCRWRGNHAFQPVLGKPPPLPAIKHLCCSNSLKSFPWWMWLELTLLWICCDDTYQKTMDMHVLFSSMMTPSTPWWQVSAMLM